MGLPGTAPRAVAAIDFLSNEARAVLAARLSDDSWRVLAVGSVPLEGIENGRITHLSDAAETVAAAIAAASRAGGREPENIFYTLHDSEAVYRRYRASRTLPGEGQVRPADVRAVFSTAERLAGGFETANLYSASLGYVIDDQDPVADPIGVFGRKIEVEAGFLQMRSETLDAWKDVFRRAYAPPTWAVPLAQAAALGAVPADPERRARLVLFQRGGESLVCRLSGASIESCETFAAGTPPALNGSAAGIDEILTAGDHAERTAEKLSKEAGLPARAAKPETAGLQTPQDAPTAGLLAVAREREKLRLTARRGHGLARKARRKMASFWNDYF